MGADIKGQTMAALPGRIDAMNEQASKACTKCGAVKLMTEFHANHSKTDGRASHCKKCASKSNAEYRKKTPEKHRLKGKNWRDRNPEYLAEYLKAWAARNPDKVRERRRRQSLRDVEQMSPRYVAHILKMDMEQITTELIAMKREQLTIRRLARQLKEKANESSTDPR